ncbi:MAG TPA: hypothetical protein VGD67_05980, partial [Pseudonocardiaceae bacterium]
MVLITGTDTRVVELRVHGPSGTTAEALVDAVAAVDVAGDGVGRLVRPADRLRRPVPGPVLTAGGRPVPRTVEGYLWGAMAGGGARRAGWALLLPFTLVNAAHWMLPPLPAGRVFGRAVRALPRAVAVLLTCLLAAQVTLLSLDLLAAQGLGLDGWALAVVGLGPVVPLAWLVHAMTGDSWTAPPPGPGTGRWGDGSWLTAAPQPREPAGSSPVPSSAGDPDGTGLRGPHTAAVLGTAALAATGGPSGP